MNGEIISLSLDKSEIQIDENEALRYMGYHKEVPSEEFEKLGQKVHRQILQVIEPKVCYMEVPVQKLSDHQVDLKFMTLDSAPLAKLIGHCERAYLFAATIGVGVDREIARRSKVSLVESLVYDAFGSAAIEAVCNRACQIFKDMEEERHPGEFYLKSRFSPGYGDLAIETQEDFIRVLDTHRKIGMTLTEGMMMTPVKSVTAVVGVRKNDGRHGDGSLHNCDTCHKTDCEYRELFSK